MKLTLIALTLLMATGVYAQTPAVDFPILYCAALNEVLADSAESINKPKVAQVLRDRARGNRLVSVFLEAKMLGADATYEQRESFLGQYELGYYNRLAAIVEATGGPWGIDAETNKCVQLTKEVIAPFMLELRLEMAKREQKTPKEFVAKPKIQTYELD